jgi:hypothetical protein
MIGMAEQETRTRLSDLVVDRRARLKISLMTLAERCVDPETGEQEVKTGWLHRLEHRQSVTPPTAGQLAALAIGLELPLREVQDAAGEQFFGIVTTALETDSRIRALVSRAGGMSAEDLERLLAIAETFPLKGRDSGGSSK